MLFYLFDPVLLCISECTIHNALAYRIWDGCFVSKQYYIMLSFDHKMWSNHTAVVKPHSCEVVSVVLCVFVYFLQ